MGYLESGTFCFPDDDLRRQREPAATEAHAALIGRLLGSLSLSHEINRPGLFFFEPELSESFGSGFRNLGRRPAAGITDTNHPLSNIIDAKPKALAFNTP